ncbi:carbonic anhydrase 4-like [Heptranchias perlo]|uniref:carbonic anhydrase 4-like n=1 Tax=Heptranchias perlo TaxID=212740 RepID=UPI003559CF22
MGMEALLVLFLLGLPQLDSSKVKYCYHNSKCAPPAWPALYHTCNGSQQSPINIKTTEAVRKNDLGEFTFHMYSNRHSLMKIKHTAQSVKISIGDSLELRGGGLKSNYSALQFHLHWGWNSSSGGSEHTIDGVRAGMELHIVHARKGLRLEGALAQPGGIAVLAFFITIENGRTEDPAWKSLTKTIKYLKEEGDYRKLNGTFSLMELIQSVNLTKYYRYNGSLTTPECNEVVVWTVFEESIRLNASLVETFFEDLYINRSAGIRLHGNFRPTQDNRNRVWASRGASRASDPSTTAPPALQTQQLPKTTESGSAGSRPFLLSLLLTLACHILPPN